MAIHERVWERDEPTSRRPSYFARAAPAWRPLATYWLLGAMAVVYVLQLLVHSRSVQWHTYLFVIAPDFLGRPWTLVTSTLSHGSPSHLLLNGLFLFFLGPSLERIWGWRRLVLWFFVGGALSGVLQVLITQGGALGASGALMMVLGVLVVLMPNEKILVWGIVPVPFWVVGVVYAALDLLGAFSGRSGIGHFAHLSGLALGLALGWRTRRDLERRGMVRLRG